MTLSMKFSECLHGLPVAKFKPKFNNVFYEGSFPRRCLLNESQVRERLTKVNFDFSDEFYINEGELIRALGKIKSHEHADDSFKLEW